MLKIPSSLFKECIYNCRKKVFFSELIELLEIMVVFVFSYARFNHKCLN